MAAHPRRASSRPVQLRTVSCRNECNLLLVIPNANARTEKNLDALIAGRVLYPDGTLNTFIERYLRDRVVKLFSASTRRQQETEALSA